jgi:hypothetical protein
VDGILHARKEDGLLECTTSTVGADTLTNPVRDKSHISIIVYLLYEIVRIGLF